MVLKAIHLFTLILTYEAFFISFIGVLQILGTYIYREDRYPLRYAWIKWFELKKFAELKPDERQRYRQEGKIMIIIGLVICFAVLVVHFSILH
jgi:hypothetical protein